MFKDLIRFFALAGSALLVFQAATAAETVTGVGFGDSLMAGYQLPSEDAFPEKLEAELKSKGYDIEIVNAGVSGDTSSGGLARLDWSVPDGTNFVILELGANDALRGIPPEITRENIETMIKRLQERGIDVILAGMMAPPNLGDEYAKAFNAIFPDLAEKYDVSFYPFFLDGVIMDSAKVLADGMHPNAQGTSAMAERFAPLMEEYLKERD
jgi:acyl-CoA thioesterase-1